jgi:hypothetical protein
MKASRPSLTDKIEFLSRLLGLVAGDYENDDLT